MKSQAVLKNEATSTSESGFGNAMSDSLKKAITQNYPSLFDYAGIFLISAAVLLFEVALTRVFAVILWAHLAFMVVSTALFGFGLSGVYLALKSRKTTKSWENNLSLLCFLVSLAMIGAYLIVTNVPFRMWKFQENALNYLYLGLWYLALVVPFFFAGLLIAQLLSNFPIRSSRLYGVDLVGAASGALLLVPAITVLGGEGTVVFAAFLATLAGMSLLKKGQKMVCGLLALGAAILAIILPQAEDYLPLKYHQNKRRFNQALDKNKVMATRWSPISKVDVAVHAEHILDIWIDGGTNESAIFKWSGEDKDLTPLTWSSIGVIPNLKRGTSPNALIIGPSGGKEVLFALSHGASHIDAVEMDPSIVHFTSISPFKEFMGGLYQHEKVNFVNDEGRAYMRRQPRSHYDIIQFVNNYTPIAIASGALNLSEAFLITKEAFHDYLDHLKPNGVLALHRGATLRVALTALATLRERGVANPERHIVITAGEVPFFEGFFLKNGEWTKEEVENISQYMATRPKIGGRTFLWNPFEPTGDSLYRLIGAPVAEQEAAYSDLGINLFPATDNRPFIEHFLQFGKRELSDQVPNEFHKRNNEKWRGLIPRGDFPYVAILVESALLALFFVGLPLVSKARGSIRLKGFWGVLGYFSALGLAFIIIEICLMKRYVMFLGNPAYSVTTILVALLLGAGLGSMSCERIAGQNPRRALAILVPVLALVILSETWVSPIVFDSFIHLEFAGRVAVASLLLLPLGFMMGMPFPLGLKLINQMHPDESSRRQLIAWAWGMNGYFTVVGSASTIFIALFFGFKAALLTGVVVYLLGLGALLLATRKALG